MKVEVICDESIDETKIIIYAQKINSDIQKLQSKIENIKPEVLSGFYNEKLEIINPENIVRIYADRGRTKIRTPEKEYSCRLSLYEVEARLETPDFVKISRSEIISLKKTLSFDLSFVGTISVLLSNGDVSYVSRRYLKQIKSILGV